MVILHNSLFFLHLDFTVQFRCPNIRKDINRLKKYAFGTRKYENYLRDLNFFLLETQKKYGHLAYAFKNFQKLDNIEYNSMFQLSEGVPTKNFGIEFVLEQFYINHYQNFFSCRIF